MDTFGCSGKFCSADRFSDGTFVLAYFSNGDIVVTTSYPVGDELGWNRTVIDNNGIVGEYASIAVSSDDKVNIFYFDMRNNALKWARETAE